VNGLQQTIYDISRALLWPVLIAAILCLIWVLIELGFFLYELYLRFRYRDIEALEARTLRARKAFADGKPRTAYRYLQENNYSLVVAHFLFDLIRNYQTQRLAAKPLKLLQDYEFYTVKRLERTRILVRIGPMLGLMGTLIPLSPALVGLATGNVAKLSVNLVTAFSVTVVGLLIGGIAFVISIVRDRIYSQDISDMEYLLELLEGRGGRLSSGRKRDKKGVWDTEPSVEYVVDSGDVEHGPVIPQLDEVPVEPLVPVASGNGDRPATVVAAPVGAIGADDLAATQGMPAAPLDAESVVTPPANGGGAPTAPAVDTAAPAPAPLPEPSHDDDLALGFDDPTMSWHRDDDPFADLGPVDPVPPLDPPGGAGGSSGGR
jgi:biopolymer transport protein ExbB/TolQ